jgi:hypothetical protein
MQDHGGDRIRIQVIQLQKRWPLPNLRCLRTLRSREERKVKHQRQFILPWLLAGRGGRTHRALLRGSRGRESPGEVQEVLGLASGHKAYSDTA